MLDVPSTTVDLENCDGENYLWASRQKEVKRGPFHCVVQLFKYNFDRRFYEGANSDILKTGEV